jgi:hypothetical protein
MIFLFSLLLPLLTCVLLSGATAILWRSVLPSAWSYLGLALLVLLGLHRILQVGAEIVKLFSTSGYFLEYQKKPNVVEMAERSFTLEAVVISLLIVLFSWPILSWLRNLLAR